MKRQLIPILLAALVGAASASAAALLLGIGAQRSTPRTGTTASGKANSSSGTRREVASTTPTATQIYRQDSTGVVAIKAVTSEGEDRGPGSCSTNAG